MPPSVLGWGRADRCGPSGDAGGSRPLRRIRGGPGARGLVVCGSVDEFLPGVWTIVRQASRHPRASHSAADRRGRSRPPLVCEREPPGNADEPGANLLHLAVEHPEASGDRGPPAFVPELRVSADKAVASAPRSSPAGDSAAGGVRRRGGAVLVERTEDARNRRRHGTDRPATPRISRAARGNWRRHDATGLVTPPISARYLPHATPGGPLPGLLRGRPRVPRGVPLPGTRESGKGAALVDGGVKTGVRSRYLDSSRGPDVTGARAPARGGPPGRARSPPCRRPASRRSGG